jgi:hypothetical protein
MSNKDLDIDLQTTNILADAGVAKDWGEWVDIGWKLDGAFKF